MFGEARGTAARCSHGEVHVVRRVAGYKKIRYHIHENVGYGPVNLPDQEMHTTAVWWELADWALESAFAIRESALDGFLGAAHALHHMAALASLAELRDLGRAVGDGAATWTAVVAGDGRGTLKTLEGATLDPDARRFRPTLYLYDNYPGGIGLAAPLYESRATLVGRARPGGALSLPGGLSRLCRAGTGRAGRDECQAGGPDRVGPPRCSGAECTRVAWSSLNCAAVWPVLSRSSRWRRYWRTTPAGCWSVSKPSTAGRRSRLGGVEAVPGLVQVIRRYPLSLRHGRLALAELTRLEYDRHGALRWTRRLTPDRLVFLDTETTGLAGGAGSLAFLVGVARLAADALELTQWLLTAFAGEAAMLHRLSAALAPEDVLVSLNGKAFDLPLLETRARLLGLREGLRQRAHIDLLHALRRAHGRSLSDCRLQTAETRLLGIQPQHDLPGALAPAAWRAWLTRGEVGSLGEVLAHNRDDLLSTALLLAVLARARRTLPWSKGLRPSAIVRAGYHAGMEVPCHPQKVGAGLIAGEQGQQPLDQGPVVTALRLEGAQAQQQEPGDGQPPLACVAVQALPFQEGVIGLQGPPFRRGGLHGHGLAD